MQFLFNPNPYLKLFLNLLQVYSGLSYKLTVDTCSSTQSRMCWPELLLQLNTTKNNAIQTPNTDTSQLSSGQIDTKLIQYDKQQLFQLYEQLEEIQIKLDSMN